MTDNNDNIDNISSKGPKPRYGIYKAKVVAHLDTTFMGVLTVKIERYAGNDEVEDDVEDRMITRRAEQTEKLGDLSYSEEVQK